MSPVLNVTNNKTNHGLLVIVSVPNATASVEERNCDEFPLPKPFEHITATCSLLTTPCLYIKTSEKRPEQLMFKMQIRGRHPGWYFDLSQPQSETLFGSSSWPSDLAANWSQKDGSVIVECEIILHRSVFSLARDELLVKSFKEKSFADFKLTCGNNTINIAKAIVGPQSRFFQKMFKTNAKSGDIRNPNMSYESLKLIIEYLYSGVISGEVIDRHVLLAAEQLEIANINGLYETFASKHITLENVDEKLRNARQFALPSLEEKCVEFLGQNRNWRVGFDKYLETLPPIKLLKKRSERNQI